MAAVGSVSPAATTEVSPINITGGHLGGMAEGLLGDPSTSLAILGTWAE